jgi:O-antigen/teichoic acid export membrane protein
MIVSSILSLVGLFFMMHYLGEDSYGSLIWLLSTLGTLNAVADLGFGSAHIKRVSEGMDENDCISTFIAIKLVLTGFMVIFVFASLLLWTNVMGGSLSPGAWGFVILFVLYYVMYDIASIATVTFTARMETTKSQLVVLVDPLIRIPLIIFISINHMTSNDLAYAYVLAALGVLLVSIFLLRRDKLHWKRPTLFNSYLKFTLPIALISVAGVVAFNLDKILIGYFDSLGSVGIYTAAQTLLGTFGVVGIAVATLAFPSFSKFHTDGDIESIRRMTHAAERYIAMIGIPVVTLIILFPTEVYTALFPNANFSGGEAMRFLAIAMMLTLLNQVHTSQILGVNRPDISAKISWLTFIVNVLLLLLFIPKELFGVKMLGMSYTGAAIAGALTALFTFFSVRLVVKNLTGTGTNPRIFRHIIAGIVTGGALEALNLVFPLSGIFRLILFAAVTLLVFFAVLTALKEFTRADIVYFLDLLSPSKMYSYMGDEMKNKK